MIFDYVIFNGDLIRAEQAQISIFHPAYFASFGVYETVKIDRGRPFYLDEHLHRLHKSAHMIELALGVPVATLRQWFDKLLAVDPQATWSLKILALGPTALQDRPFIAMQPTPLPTYPDKLYTQGATAITYEGQRHKPTCKSLNMLVNYLAHRAATQANALEGLLYHNGHFSEGSRSNLFAVRDGLLITPPTHTVLSGITHDIILEVMQQTGHPVIETEVPAQPHLYEEFFISSTSMHVMPITRIDGQSIGDGTVGSVTKVAMAQFATHYQYIVEQK